jgi:predicted XRE-type DNA-binding protein
MNVSEKKQSFRDRMNAARPDVVEQQKENAIKVGIARKLRILRDARGMTQKDVAKASGMQQSAISRLEALSGPTPSLDSIKRYVDACGGHLDVVVSTRQNDGPGSAVA